MSDQPVSRDEMNEIIGGFNRSINEGIQNMMRSVFTEIGSFSTKLDTISRQQEGLSRSIESVEVKVDRRLDEISERVSKNEEQITQLNRLMFGDSRTLGSPYIRKDIDRHESEIIGLNETVRQINTDVKGLRTIFQEFNENFCQFLKRYEDDVKVVIAITNVSKRVVPPLTNGVKILLEQRWSFILPTAAAIGAAASAAIEYLKAIGLFK